MTNNQLKLLVETVQQLSLARDIEAIMKVVRTAARNLTGADGATFILRDNDFCYYADEDAIGALWKGQRFPISTCISGWAMLNRQPAVIGDIYTDNRIPIEAYRPTFVKSLVMVPIRTINPIGAIGNYWARNYTPTIEEVELLQSLADITSVSIENVYAFDELETFIYKLSHDIRGPIARMLGLVSITDIENPFSAHQFFHFTKQQAERLDSILKSLAETMDIRRGEKVYDPISFDRIVAEAKKLLELNEGFDEIDFIEEISVNQIFYSNKSLLISLFQNLIDNSIKYRKVNTPSYIRISIVDQDGGIKIIIEDNGIGIPSDLQKDVFKMFFRATEKSTGSGLGLYVISYILKHLGGEIALDSKENKGTTFSVYLPNKIMQESIPVMVLDA